MALWMTQLTFTLIAVACIACTFASKAQSVNALEGRKCARAFPWSTTSTTLKCTYLCRGWPFRYENEPDGRPCGVFPFFGKPKVCRAGKCVRVDKVTTPPSATTEASRTTDHTQQWISSAVPLLHDSSTQTQEKNTESTITEAHVTTDN